MKIVVRPFLLTALAVVFLLGCKKENVENYECTDCVTTAEAKQEFDWSTKGIYKGVVVGSSGTIKFDVMNSGTAIKATLKIDGQKVELTSDKPWQNDLGYEAPFKGNLNGQQVTIVLSLGVGGTVVDIPSVVIPGHPNAAIIGTKETSTALVECFEGEFQNSDGSGIINITISRKTKKWQALIKSNTGQYPGYGVGEIINNELRDYNGNYISTISNDIISGTAKDSDGMNTQIKAKRTL